MAKVVLVDQNGKFVGHEEKLRAHELGLLHEAFSIFIFNARNEMLIHQRALTKYHTPGLWTNACCSHLREGKTILECAHGRLLEEMGFDCNLKEIFTFTYFVKFENGLIEHEFDHVLVGSYDAQVIPNPEEVHAYKWISMNELNADVQNNPEKYTYWFKEILKKNIFS